MLGYRAAGRLHEGVLPHHDILKALSSLSSPPELLDKIINHEQKLVGRLRRQALHAAVCLQDNASLDVGVDGESPFHLGHLRNMTALAEMGAIILPPMPAFYHKPESIMDIIHQSIGKALDQVGIEHNLFQRWTGHDGKEPRLETLRVAPLVRSLMKTA